MLFNSIPFLLLFILTYILYWSVGQRGKKLILLISSITFYAYNSLALTLHFLIVIIINHGFSNLLLKSNNNPEKSKRILILAVTLNILNLSVFKYFYFITGSIYTITGLVSVKEFSLSVSIALPLAISFYTFQLIAYLVDTHRKKVIESVPLYDFLIFILFFPQLIAGPIMRSGEFLPKLHKPEVSKESIERGLYLIITGLLKKVVIADNMGSILNPVYLSPDSYSWSSLCLTNFGFAMQIYCDFGGYSDMARGLALLLGFEIPVNFRAPFLSRSFTELWSRWHITLSTWLRDYLYIPLGGNKNGPFRSNVNMLITMTLGGLWHGANITYILWGFYLGVMLWLERIGDRLFGDKFQKSYLVVPKIIIVYVLFSFSGLFFRTGMLGDKSLDICINFMRSIFTFQSGKTVYRHEELITYIVLTFVFNYIEYRGRIFDNNPLLKKVFLPIYSFLILLLLGLYGDGGGDFIYFQF